MDDYNVRLAKNLSEIEENDPNIMKEWNEIIATENLKQSHTRYYLSFFFVIYKSCYNPFNNKRKKKIIPH